MSGDDNVTKVNRGGVCQDTEGTAELLKESKGKSLSCKIKNNTDNYRITGVDKKELKISGIIIVSLTLLCRD